MELYRVWILIGKKINNEASPDEVAELTQLLSQEINKDIPVELIANLLADDQQIEDEPINKLQEKNWGVIEQFIASEGEAKAVTQLKTSEKNLTWSYLAGIAASLIIVASTYFYVINIKKTAPEDKSVNQITAPAGGVSKILLPDGSKVWLNGGSKIIYKNNFRQSLRELTLLGEAYFEVTKDPSHPFIVTTQTIQIRVLGTKFNVRAYAGDKTTEASLLEGKIELTLLKMPDHKYILRPSDKISIVNGMVNKPDSALIKNESNILTLNRIHKIKNDSIPLETEWTQNKLIFQSEDFETLAKDLERHYAVTIAIKGNKIKRWRFSGSFHHESINEALQSLRTAHEFKFEINKDKINISEN